MTPRRQFLRDLLLSTTTLAAGRHALAQPGGESLEKALALLKAGGGGLVVAMRHALAPGTFDPPGFRLDSCSTQRNLSAEGRDQARRIGAWYRERELAPRQVRSSQWCRCRETAQLAFGTAEVWPALNSYIGERTQQPARLAGLREELARLARADAAGFEVWVTHQVNISALANNYTGSGDAVLIRHEPVTNQVRVLGALRLE